MTPRREIPGLRAVLERQVYGHCFSSLDREVGGVLVGDMRQGGPPQVDAAIAAVRASESAAQLTFTQDAWQDIHHELEAQHPGKQIVGWYHTHPGYGLFLSEQDLFIHRNFFDNRSQIALVIDPVAREEAIFAWADDGVHEYYRGPVSSAAPDGPPRTRGAVSTSRARDDWGEHVAQHAQRQGPTVPSESRSRDMKAASALTWIYLALISVSAGTIFWDLLMR